jgi:uncharacterized LabA/DUF88 family protein
MNHVGFVDFNYLRAAAGLAQFEEHFQFRSELGQKGVDTRITLDLVRLAQHDVYETAILIAGDRGLAEPVRAAQDEGKRASSSQHPRRPAWRESSGSSPTP